MIEESIIALYTAKTHPTHRFYGESVVLEMQLCPHADGEYPSKLIDEARPNEQGIYKEYRKKVFEPVTKTYYDKVFNLFGKIRIADDWGVKYPDSGSYPKNESPKEYLQEDYPDFSSIENWFFSVGLNNLLDDANSVMAVFPESLQLNDNDYLKPIVHLFDSAQTIEFRNGQLCVVKLDEVPDNDAYLVSDFILPKDKVVMLFFDRNNVEKWIKVKDGNIDKFVLYFEWEHNLDVLPCLKIGGKIKEYKYGEKLFESFIQSCVPHWNEAIRRYSDHQVNMALHLHPDRWEIADQECRVCKGQGTISSTISGEKTVTACGTCHGAGKIMVKTPFGVKVVRPDTKTGASTGMAMPIPPAGYIERPIETIDYLNREWKSCIQQGLSALSMEFLMYEPAVNSGIAKVMDRSELNALIFMVASHIVNNDLLPIIYIILKQRYGRNKTDEDIKKMMPSIKIPVKYDVIIASFLLEATKYAKDSGVPGNVLDQMYLEYAAKEFGKDSSPYMQILNSMELDPLAHQTVDEKMTTLMNKGCTEEQYIISSQLPNFLIRAFAENEKFNDLPLAEKKATMETYAKEVMAVTKTELLPLVPTNTQS